MWSLPRIISFPTKGNQFPQGNIYIFSFSFLKNKNILVSCYTVFFYFCKCKCKCEQEGEERGEDRKGGDMK